MPGYIEFSNPIFYEFRLKLAKQAKKMPLFTDNAAHYYKPGSLASGGVGTVRNISTKGRRT
jgi:hypothetical protein